VESARVEASALTLCLLPHLSAPPLYGRTISTPTAVPAAPAASEPMTGRTTPLAPLQAARRATRASACATCTRTARTASTSLSRPRRSRSRRRTRRSRTLTRTSSARPRLLHSTHSPPLLGHRNLGGDCSPPGAPGCLRGLGGDCSPPGAPVCLRGRVASPGAPACVTSWCACLYGHLAQRAAAAHSSPRALTAARPLSSSRCRHGARVCHSLPFTPIHSHSLPRCRHGARIQ